MRDARIGRLVPASLHEAIAELEPSHLEFYEAWLKPEELRRGSIAPAALMAVLGFLRKDGASYSTVVSCAGRHATQWTLDLKPRRRHVSRWLPVAWRVRRAMSVARELARDSYATARLEGRVGRKGGVLTLVDSPFCDVRERYQGPLCGFYAAAVGELLANMRVQAVVDIRSCKATGDAACIFDVAVSGRAAAPPVASPDPVEDGVPSS